MKAKIARFSAVLAWTALIVAIACGVTELIAGPGYPDIAPLLIPLPPAQAFARAEAAARAMGGDIVAVSPQDLRMEATDTSLLFGFKDDVVIRVAALADVSTASSQVDVRSLSRVGGSDFGVNAKRIRDYLARLAAG